MNKRLEATMLFHDVITKFVTCADRGEASKGTLFCSDDMTVNIMGSEMPKSDFADMLMMREEQAHVTKHHVPSPTIESYSDARICGTAPIVSYRLDDDQATFAVSEFYAEIVPDTATNEWMIQKLRMVPFANFNDNGGMKFGA